jgi:hypothetical protein
MKPLSMAYLSSGWTIPRGCFRPLGGLRQRPRPQHERFMDNCYQCRERQKLLCFDGKSSRRKGSHETAVFRKIFGPFANFWRPQTIFFGEDAADLHAHVTALVRDFEPAYWNVFISANHADAALEAVMARLRSELTATENP